MISIAEVEHLAKLAKVGMTDGEKKELQKDLERILDYVSEIKEVVGDVPQELPSHRNVFREDVEPHETGKFTEDILNLSPAREGNYIKVKKVLEQGR